MSIREWVHNREIDSRPSFSYADAKDAFPSFTQQHILNDLYRLRKSGAIAQPYKGYYVVIPPHYAAMAPLLRRRYRSLRICCCVKEGNASFTSAYENDGRPSISRLCTHSRILIFLLLLQR